MEFFEIGTEMLGEDSLVTDEDIGAVNVRIEEALTDAGIQDCTVKMTREPRSFIPGYRDDVKQAVSSAVGGYLDYLAH
jgi:hypothetical protein